MFEVKESTLFRVGDQHYHLMCGYIDYPSHNVVFDDFDEAIISFIALVDECYPNFFDDDKEREDVMETIYELSLDSSFEQQKAKALISLGEYKIGFADCFGCIYPWAN